MSITLKHKIMTRSIKTLTIVALLTVTSASTLFAKGNRTTLTQNDWTEIANEAMMESILNIESIPAFEVYLIPEEWAAIEEEAEKENTSEIEAIPTVQLFLLPDEWNAIETEVETENMMEFESIPLMDLGSVKQGQLNLDLKSGKKVNLVLDAPFSNTDQVGIAVINQTGKLIYAKSGLFGEVKDLSFSTAFTKNATYIVRVYSTNKVYETNLQVLYI
jgi:hypothetical protein